jgi:hypothetical protein
VNHLRGTLPRHALPTPLEHAGLGPIGNGFPLRCSHAGDRASWTRVRWSFLELSRGKTEAMQGRSQVRGAGGSGRSPQLLHIHMLPPR